MSTNAKKVQVTLLKPHTHRGEQLKKGDTIEVSEQIAAWLADPKRGIIAPRDQATGKGE